MSVKFTTGSWIKEESLTPDGRGTGTYNIYQNSEDGHWVAFTGTVHDARLIAAAPDLLAVCRCALADLEGLELDSDDCPAALTIKELRAAIAKATGVQS